MSVVDEETITLLRGDFFADKIGRLIFSTIYRARNQCPQTWGTLTGDLIGLIVDMAIGAVTPTYWKGPSMQERLQLVPLETVMEAFLQAHKVHPMALHCLLGRKVCVPWNPRYDRESNCYVKECTGHCTGLVEFRKCSFATTSMGRIGYRVRNPATGHLLPSVSEMYHNILCPDHLLSVAGLAGSNDEDFDYKNTASFKDGWARYGFDFWSYSNPHIITFYENNGYFGVSGRYWSWIWGAKRGYFGPPR